METTAESVALILATHEDVVSHGHVLYGLVKGGQEPNTVESTSRMVNVVPRKRIYCMNSVDELVEFRKEILKRPLVLQPIIQAGTGIQSLDCFFCVKKESWVLMVNQFHPKLIEKISSGMDLAARAMFRGEGFVLEFSFGDVLKKHYYGNISKLMSPSFAYTDCEFGDVIIRSLPKISTSSKVSQLKISFEDVLASEIKVRTLAEAATEIRSPVLEFIPISQLTELMPGWVFDEEEVEESIVSTSDYHSDTNIGATGGDVITSQPRRQRSSAYKPNKPNKHYVAVDMHASQEPFHSIPEEDPSHDSDCDNEVGRYFHFHQGSGRSDSSVGDSGYEDTGYQGKTRIQGRSNRKQLYRPENVAYTTNDLPQVHSKKSKSKHFPRVNNRDYDNLGYSSDEDVRGPNYYDYGHSNYEDTGADVIVTRTGKKTFKSLDRESLAARMMDESVM